jgi:hypothetical protein
MHSEQLRLGSLGLPGSFPSQLWGLSRMGLTFKGGLYAILQTCALLAPVAVCNGCASSGAVVARAPGTVVVLVAASPDHQPLPDTRVFILSSAGTVLAEAITDGNGTAVLQRRSEALRPVYVLCEHRQFFLGGSRWRPKSEEYHSVLAVGAVR